MLIPILIANVALGWTIAGWILILIAAGLAPIDRGPVTGRS